MNVNLVAVEARKKQQTIENVYAVLFEFNFVCEYPRENCSNTTKTF